MKRVMITGATGTMGLATLRELAQRSDRFEITVLARPSKKNRRILREFQHLPGFRIAWGDLTSYGDVAYATLDADYVLHIGGMVSPAADYYPERTLKVNTLAAQNVARAALASPKADSIKVVYIGSIAQSGDRRPPHHWARTGDPIAPSRFDAYARSKVMAERIIVESGLKHWACLRQTGILCPELLLKGTDPITFHVPFRGVLEWATAEDSGRLMANICEDSVPDSFWNRFYNIGSGREYRLTNYEFEARLLKALGVGSPRQVFEPKWFALQNFHGAWWADSDELEAIVPFRANIPVDEYFAYMRRKAPGYFRLAPLAPSPLVKAGMRLVAQKKPLGTLYWLKSENHERIDAAFGSLKQWAAIGSWEEELPSILSAIPEAPEERTPDHAVPLSHGYDESKPLSELSIDDMRAKAAFHGGKCLSTSMTPGDLATPLQWDCAHGHKFAASPALVLLGGHWCPDCL